MYGGIEGESGCSHSSGVIYGNRLTNGSATLTYGLYNKLQNDGTWDYAYDGNGNLAWKTGTSNRYQYQFNSLDQLTSITKWKKQGRSFSQTT